MARAARTCKRCPAVITAGALCTPCLAKQRQLTDQRRGSSTARGYTGAGHRTFRTAVLTRDPICVLCHRAWSTIADHWPVSRRDLEDQHLNPNDPAHGRGLCKPCHDRETATNQPGGWYANQLAQTNRA